MTRAVAVEPVIERNCMRLMVSLGRLEGTIDNQLVTHPAVDFPKEKILLMKTGKKNASMDS